MKKIILFFLLFFFNSGCTPTYRILTIDHNYNPNVAHQYEIININTGIIDTIYDAIYYVPGVYVKINDDSTSIIRIIKVIE